MTVRTRLPAAARREQILDATKSIAVQRGFHAVSIDAVARAAGISRPIVYDHFHDLPGLLEALIERETLRSREQLAAVLPADVEPGDLRGALYEGIRRYLAAAQSDPDTWRLVLMPPEGAPELMRERIAAGREDAIAQLGAAVGAQLTDAPDRELLVRMLSSLSDEAVRLLLTRPDEYPPERLLAGARWMIDRLV
ncbi:MAG TPA: TetR/AcrR family transcriptional regulator [Solirubrobacteraceae bacterium]